MKVYKIKTSIRSDVESKIISTLHKEKNNSLTENYSKISINNNNNISTDNELTGLTDGDCNIIFNDSLYTFLNKELPEEIETTYKVLNLINHTILNTLGNGVDFFEFQYIKVGYKLFISNIINGVYNNNIEFDFKNFINEYNSILSQEKNFFVLLIKDSLGNEFATTKKANRNKIRQGYSSVIKVPISDSTTGVKDGFNTNDVMKFYYKNITKNIELELIVNSYTNLLAADKENIIVNLIEIKEESKKIYNNLIYELK